MQSLYESVYAPKDEKVNFILTNEEFEELCTCILVETFNSVVLDEVTKKMAKDAVTNPKIRDTAVKVLTKIFKPETVKGGITRYGTAYGVADAATGGKTNKRVRAVVNPKNLYGYVKGMFTAADKNMQGAGQILKDKEKGNFYTTDQARRKDLNNSFEFDGFNLYIVEAKSADKLADKLNQQEKDKKKKEEEAKKAAALEKKELSEPDFDDPSRNIGRGGSKGELNKAAEAEKKRKEEKAKKKEKERKAKELENKELSEPDFDDPSRNIGRGGAMPKPVEKKEIKKDDKKNEIKKDKPKQYSTPVKDKTGLGSPIKPIKPGGARDIARARNEITFGSDRVGKLVNKTADFKAYKRGDITKQQFADKYPNSQTAKTLKKSKLPPSVMDFESYEPYDLVLDYVLSEGHADTLDEANYVMMQMDENTIQQIIEMSSPYTISQADVNARTPAFENYQKEVKNKITGEPLYKLGSGVNLPKI